MSRLPKFAAMTVMAVALSGCQSMPVIGHWFGGSKDVTERPAPALAGAQVLEEGREQLRTGQISAAIASFRMARMDPAVAADANNGLGVAYIRLGRFDLADRYFRTALDLEPQNERFAANLLRLRHDVMLAHRARVEAQQLAVAEPVPAAETPRIAAAPVPVPAEQPRSRRISRSAELRITTSPQLDDRASSIEVVSAPTQTITLAEAMATLPEVGAAEAAPARGPLEVVFNNN
jgi:tetratricopeptide (TPR) repeat protein